MESSSIRRIRIRYENYYYSIIFNCNFIRFEKSFGNYQNLSIFLTYFFQNAHNLSIFRVHCETRTILVSRIQILEIHRTLTKLINKNLRPDRKKYWRRLFQLDPIARDRSVRRLHARFPPGNKFMRILLYAYSHAGFRRGSRIINAPRSVFRNGRPTVSRGTPHNSGSAEWDRQPFPFKPCTRSWHEIGQA